MVSSLYLGIVNSVKITAFDVLISPSLHTLKKFLLCSTKTVCPYNVLLHKVQTLFEADEQQKLKTFTLKFYLSP